MRFRELDSKLCTFHKVDIVQRIRADNSEHEINIEQGLRSLIDPDTFESIRLTSLSPHRNHTVRLTYTALRYIIDNISDSIIYAILYFPNAAFSKHVCFQRLDVPQALNIFTQVSSVELALCTAFPDHNRRNNKPIVILKKDEGVLSFAEY